MSMYPFFVDPPNNSATNPVKESVSSSNVLFQKPWTLNLFKEYSSSTEKTNCCISYLCTSPDI